jgi:hypothetical protein
MTNNKFFKLSHDYFINNLPEGYDLDDVMRYLNGSNIHISNMNDVVKRLAITLQNYQGVKNFIGYFSRNEFSIKNTLFDFDSSKILSKYNSEDELYNAFIENGCDMKSSQKSWKSYSQRLLLGIEWLSQFRDFNYFNDFITHYRGREIDLPILMENQKVKNTKFIGFALACDFIKEIGYLSYSKPDIHIKDILNATYIDNKNTEYDLVSYTEKGLFEKMSEIAKDNNVTPYFLDKLLWSIASGECHAPLNIKLTTSKKEFIKMIKSKI